MTLELDLERSLVRVADRWFPAVGVLCPCHETNERCREWWPDEAEHTWQHLLAELARPDVWVPCENGTGFNIEPFRWVTSTREVQSLHVSWWDLRLTTVDTYPVDAGWIPAHLRSWSDADPEWVVETVDRLGRQGVAPYAGEQPRGPAPQLLPLRRVEEIWNEHEGVKR